MSVILVTDPSMRCPNPFPKTDSKDFLSFMFDDRVEVLERSLGLDLGPLKYVATDTSDAAWAEIRENWGEEAEAMISHIRRSSELAWHPPDAFVSSLEQLAERLERDGRKLPEEVARAVDPSGLFHEYVQTGVFFEDVTGCLVAIRWAKDHGAQRVQFWAY